MGLMNLLSFFFFNLYVCRQYSVGFEMVTVSTVGDPGSAAFQKKSSGDYRYSQLTEQTSLVSPYHRWQDE